MGVFNENVEYYDVMVQCFLYNYLEYIGFIFYFFFVEGYFGFFKVFNYSKFWFDQFIIVYWFCLFYVLLEGKIVQNNWDILFQVDVVFFFWDNFNNQEYVEELVWQFLEFMLFEMLLGEWFDYFF